MNGGRDLWSLSESLLTASFRRAEPFLLSTADELNAGDTEFQLSFLDRRFVSHVHCSIFRLFVPV
jgi:hypothetical protein